MRLLYFILLVCITQSPTKANEPLATIPFKMVNNHMYFEMKVNDSQALHFIFDTGAASTIMSSSTARRLGIKSTGSSTSQGASGSASVQVSNNHSIEFGGIRLSNIDLYMLNIDHLKVFGVPLDGIIGGDMLNEYVIEFDYDVEVMKLYDKTDFEQPENWQSQSFVLGQFGIPIVNGTVTLPSGQTLTGKYLVDTGAGLAVKFNTPFVEQNDLIDVLGPSRNYQTFDLSSSVTDKISTVPSYEVLGHTFKGFQARLSQTKAGVSGLARFDGILGHAILRQFNTIYDYDERVMYLRPNKGYGKEF